MQNKNTEIEAKYILKNPKEVIGNLDKFTQCTFRDQVQNDSYYVPMHRNFMTCSPVSEWFRVRVTESDSTINYKNWDNKNGLTMKCEELEVHVDDQITMKAILEKLDFKQIVNVEKYRSSWIYKGVEISIDRVVNLGYYVEFELKQDLPDRQSPLILFESIIQKFGFDLGEQNFEGYPMLLIQRAKEDS